MKEMIRKLLVAIKKNPQAFPLAAHTVAFCIFSLNLTIISNTTAKVYGPNMGLSAFAAMLCGILAYVCLFSAYPKRKKPNIPMILMILVLYAVTVVADTNYMNGIYSALYREVNPIKIDAKNFYIYQAYYIIQYHIIAVAVSAVLVVTEPIYAKLLKKIRTSIDVEGNGDLGSIELSEDE